MDSPMLTTVDNPFDPFTQFDEWNAWDLSRGYNTLGLLARIIVTSSDLSDPEQEDAYAAAVQEIVEENVLGLYISVAPGTQPRARLIAS